MFTLTGFADEISADLDEQLDVLDSLGIHHLEFRAVWQKNCLALTDDELAKAADRIAERGFRVSAVGSPIGKVLATDDFDAHLKAFNRAIQVARALDTNYIRVFSFFIPEGQDPSDHQAEVRRRMRALVEGASDAGVVLLLENEKHIYGDTAERYQELLDEFASPHLRAAFDPANFVQCGVKPFTDAYPRVEQYVDYLHIKDALFETGKVVPAGEGEGEVRPILRSLMDRHYHGFLSLEPHLSSAGPYSGFSGPDLFRVAAEALKQLLSELGAEWN